MTRHGFMLGTVAAIAVAMPWGPAFAQDIDGALERLKVLMAEQAVVIDWASVERDGADATLIGVTAQSEGQSVEIGDVSLEGISEDDVGYRIEMVSLPRYEFGDDDDTVEIDGIWMSGVILPNEEEINRYGGFLFYSEAEVESIVVRSDGRDAFTMDGVTAQVDEPGADGPMGFTAGAEAFTVDLSVLPDANQRAVVQALGYEQLTGSLAMDGNWNPVDGRLTLSRNEIIVDEAGTLGFTVDLGGYTTEFVAAVRQMQQAMADNPEQDESAQGLAVLGLMQQLTLHGAEIAYGDDGLTQNVLGFVAQQQGVQASDVANQAKAMLPFAMAQLNNPDLSAMVTGAVNAFLDNPQSLRITAAPANPTPFALIMAGAMASPQSLTSTLGLTVTAND